MVQSAGSWRQFTVVFDGPCERCGVTLVKGTVALYDWRTRKMRCTECPMAPATPPGDQMQPVAPTRDEPPIYYGTAGASAA